MKTTAQVLREHALYGKAADQTLLPPNGTHAKYLALKDWPIDDSMKYVEVRMLMFLLAEALENPC